MSIRPLLVFVFAFCFVAASHADVHYRVKLNVSATENIKGEVVSYLSRQLRQISDIDIVDDDPTIIISVIALETRNKGGLSTGYALSILVQRPIRYPQMREVLATKLDKGAMAVLDLAFVNSTAILSHFIQTGGSDELESLCRKIIADIDGNVFENERKFSRQLVEEFKKSLSTPSK